jgi:hypothetical protein
MDMVEYQVQQALETARWRGTFTHQYAIYSGRRAHAMTEQSHARSHAIPVPYPSQYEHHADVPVEQQE